MPAYSYEALDLEGKTRRGTLEADTAKSARGQLRGQKLVPLQVQVLGQAQEPHLLTQLSRTPLTAAPSTPTSSPSGHASWPAW
jgi:general secretion pathway protein F